MEMNIAPGVSPVLGITERTSEKRKVACKYVDRQKKNNRYNPPKKQFIQLPKL
jgi:hypothetical protein